MAVYTSKYTGTEIDAHLDLADTNAADITTINTKITEMQTTDAELRVKIGSDYSALCNLITDVQEDLDSNVETINTQMNSHINDTDVHITTDERTLWNSGISYSLPSTTISDESDADDYTTDGQYKATSASTLTNFAQSTYGFELIVMHTVSSNRGMQIMLCSNGDIYVRAFNSANSNGAFYGMSWKQLTS